MVLLRVLLCLFVSFDSLRPINNLSVKLRILVSLIICACNRKAARSADVPFAILSYL